MGQFVGQQAPPFAAVGAVLQAIKHNMGAMGIGPRADLLSGLLGIGMMVNFYLAEVVTKSWLK